MLNEKKDWFYHYGIRRNVRFFSVGKIVSIYLCIEHAKKVSKPELFEPWNRGIICDVAGCDKQAQCERHYYKKNVINL